jgi:endoglucanase
MHRWLRPARRTPLRRWLAAAAVLLAMTALAVVSAPNPASAAPVPPGYLLARPLFEDGGWFNAHTSGAMGCCPTDSRYWPLMSEIMVPHHAQWFSSFDTSGIHNAVQQYVSQANAWTIPLYTWAVPQLVAYWIPNRDCGSLSAGGSQSLADYGNWITNFANGIKDGLAGHTQPVIVLLEPDALALQSGDAGCTGATFVNSDRDNALKNAINTLHSVAGTNVHVYLDAGHSAWYGSNVATIVNRLVGGGIAQADGFFTNASNYQTTADETTYGKNVINQLNSMGITGKQQIIDTSRNGAGAGMTNQSNGWPNWCDNLNAKLGQLPTLNTGDPNIAGYLWIKPPGETDGCYGGPSTTPPGTLPSTHLPAGSFSADRACLLLADNCNFNPNSPPTPTGLTATKVAGHIVVEWNPSEGACNYNVAVTGDATTLVVTGELWWVDQDQTPGVHTFKVNAVDGDCRSGPPPTSPWSNTVSVTLP